MCSVLSLVLIHSSIGTISQHIPCEDIAGGWLVYLWSVSCIAHQGCVAVTNKLHVSLFSWFCHIVCGFQYLNLLKSQYLGQNLLCYDSRVCGGSGVLHTLNNVRVLFQSQVCVIAQDKRLVFGWANVSVDVGGNEVVDLQEDMIDPETLEAAAYKFAELYRDGGEMHERTGTAVMVESVVLTEEKQAAMGLAAGTLPIGWWIGFRVTDDDVWEKVKSGEYSMFSIGGTAIREEIEDDGAAAE